MSWINDYQSGLWGRQASGRRGFAIQAPPATHRLDYEDVKGDRTLRDVTINAVYQEMGAIYIEAFCHLRGAERNFRIDRIIAMYSLPSPGERIDPHRWALRILGHDPTEGLIDGFAEELAILALLHNGSETRKVLPAPIAALAARHVLGSTDDVTDLAPADVAAAIAARKLKPCNPRTALGCLLAMPPLQARRMLALITDVAEHLPEARQEIADDLLAAHDAVRRFEEKAADPTRRQTRARRKT